MIMFFLVGVVLCIQICCLAGTDAAIEVRGDLTLNIPARVEIKCYFSAGAVEGFTIAHERKLYVGPPHVAKNDFVYVNNKVRMVGEYNFHDADLDKFEVLSVLSRTEAEGEPKMYQFHVRQPPVTGLNGKPGSEHSKGPVASSSIGDLITGVTVSMMSATCEDAGVYRCGFFFSAVEFGRLVYRKSYDVHTLDLLPHLPKQMRSLPDMLDKEQLVPDKTASVNLTCSVYTTVSELKWQWEVLRPGFSWTEVRNHSHEDHAPPQTNRCHIPCTSSIIISVSHTDDTTKYRCMAMHESMWTVSMFDVQEDLFKKAEPMLDMRKILSVAGWTILIFIIFVFIFLIATSVTVAVYHANGSCRIWLREYCPICWLRCSCTFCRDCQRRLRGRSRHRPGEHPLENDRRRVGQQDGAQNTEASPQRRRNKSRRDPRRKGCPGVDPMLSSSISSSQARSPSLTDLDKTLLEICGTKRIKATEMLELYEQQAKVNEACRLETMQKQTTAPPIDMVELCGTADPDSVVVGLEAGTDTTTQLCLWQGPTLDPITLSRMSKEHKQWLLEYLTTTDPATPLSENGNGTFRKSPPSVTLDTARLTAFYKTNKALDERLTDSDPSSNEPSFLDSDIQSRDYHGVFLDSKPSQGFQHNDGDDEEDADCSSTTIVQLADPDDVTLGIGMGLDDVVCDDRGRSMDSDEMTRVPMPPTVMKETETNDLGSRETNRASEKTKAPTTLSNAVSNRESKKSERQDHQVIVADETSGAVQKKSAPLATPEEPLGSDIQALSHGTLNTSIETQEEPKRSPSSEQEVPKTSDISNKSENKRVQSQEEVGLTDTSYESSKLHVHFNNTKDSGQTGASEMRATPNTDARSNHVTTDDVTVGQLPSTETFLHHHGTAASVDVVESTSLEAVSSETFHAVTSETFDVTAHSLSQTTLRSTSSQRNDDDNEDGSPTRTRTLK